MKSMEYMFKSDAIYVIDEVASDLGITRDRIDDEIRNGRLTVIRMGHARLVRGASLVEWLASSETTGEVKSAAVRMAAMKLASDTGSTIATRVRQNRKLDITAPIPASIKDRDHA